ncbi:hypothetical protein [Ectobacillus panaciterrae]|nr:hypothetical protein [Ectobacillus panaciterrae]
MKRQQSFLKKTLYILSFNYNCKEEDRADESSRFMLEKVTQELGNLVR